MPTPCATVPAQLYRHRARATISDDRRRIGAVIAAIPTPGGSICRDHPGPRPEPALHAVLGHDGGDMRRHDVEYGTTGTSRLSAKREVNRSGCRSQATTSGFTPVNPTDDGPIPRRRRWWRHCPCYPHVGRRTPRAPGHCHRRLEVSPQCQNRGAIGPKVDWVGDETPPRADKHRPAIMHGRHYRMSAHDHDGAVVADDHIGYRLQFQLRLRSSTITGSPPDWRW